MHSPQNSCKKPSPYFAMVHLLHRLLWCVDAPLYTTFSSGLNATTAMM